MSCRNVCIFCVFILCLVDYVWHCFHLAGEDRAVYFPFLWVAACIYAVSDGLFAFPLLVSLERYASSWTSSTLFFSTMQINAKMKRHPASILYKSTAGRYWPDGLITARCRFIEDAYWDAYSRSRWNRRLKMNCMCSESGIQITATDLLRSWLLWRRWSSGCVFSEVKQRILRLVPIWVTAILDFVEEPANATNATFGGSSGITWHHHHLRIPAAAGTDVPGSVALAPY